MSTDVGDTLRDYVIGLLEADGHRLTREPRVNTKRIDIVLNLDDEYVSRKIAIECKNVDHNLSQNELALIYADYLSLVERKSVHEVWVVARRGYSPEALNWAHERSNFEVFTLSEFEERRHGFRSFVRQLSGMFSEGGLDKYYVPQRVGTGKQLEQVVFDWIESDDPRPMALLGGYGMGKTSFCRFLVAELGKRYLEDPMKRVPVFIRLADIAKQQELSGLIAKTLAERYRVKDYHFEKFRKLNEMGKLVLIFDGFDEMKHALSWWEFKYNFSQINSVVKGRAKVIIAGRPNAFLSDFEHDWVLRGIRVAGEQRVRLPEWPEYIEVEMEPFSKDEAKLFLHRYLGAQLRGSDSLTQAETDWIEKRVAEFNDIKRRDELLRPVHLKIFSDIAADQSIVLRDFSIFELYNIATTRISEREGEKVERALIDPEVRQECIEGIAWWLWEGSDGRALSFNPTDVPFTLIDLAFVGNSDHTVDGMYREIFSGPFVERKLGEHYYFAHRSFLEFFVAKKLARSREQKFSLGLISKNLNPEIISFMREGKLLTQFLNYALDAMQAFSGELEFYLLDAIQKHVDETGKKTSDMQLSAEMVLRYLFLYANESIEGLIERAARALEEDFASKHKERIETALYFGADVVRSNLGKMEILPLVEAIVRKCIMEVDWKHWRNRQRGIEEGVIPRLAFSRANVPEFLILRHSRIAPEQDASGSAIIVLDFEGMYRDMFAVRKPRIVVAGRDPATNNEPGQIRLALRPYINPKDEASAVEVLREGVRLRLGN